MMGSRNGYGLPSNYNKPGTAFCLAELFDAASELRDAIHRVESAQVDLRRIQEALDTFKTLEIIQPEPEKKKEAKEI